MYDTLCLCLGDGHTGTPPTGRGCDRLGRAALWPDVPGGGEQTPPTAALPLQRLCATGQGSQATGHPDQHLHCLPGSTEGIKL